LIAQSFVGGNVDHLGELLGLGGLGGGEVLVQDTDYRHLEDGGFARSGGGGDNDVVVGFGNGLQDLALKFVEVQEGEGGAEGLAVY